MRGVPGRFLGRRHALDRREVIVGRADTAAFRSIASRCHVSTPESWCKAARRALSHQISAGAVIWAQLDEDHEDALVAEVVGERIAPPNCRKSFFLWQAQLVAVLDRGS
jgi:hypothetical protein